MHNFDYNTIAIPEPISIGQPCVAYEKCRCEYFRELTDIIRDHQMTLQNCDYVFRAMSKPFPCARKYSETNEADVRSIITFISQRACFDCECNVNDKICIKSVKSVRNTLRKFFAMPRNRVQQEMEPLAVSTSTSNWTLTPPFAHATYVSNDSWPSPSEADSHRNNDNITLEITPWTPSVDDTTMGTQENESGPIFLHDPYRDFHPTGNSPNPDEREHQRDSYPTVRGGMDDPGWSIDLFEWLGFTAVRNQDELNEQHAYEDFVP
ncbi:hypothetical protein CVT24_006443 [Panaeolus cyanescens]|uniref:Uncharacterized protein n=1 Tax=Panaeolus cyanescens TaxID=181874 RepID=A0A409X6C7_9AGAR|nr:hypothetical protein CVT24_006443 [Panaeolus cyanescens]